MIIRQYASSSKGNLYMVTPNIGQPLLLEAGLPISQIRRLLFEDQWSLRDCIGCLITHEHGDHAKAATDLIRAGVQVYCSHGTCVAAKIQYAVAVEAGDTFTVGNFKVRAFKTEHDAAEPLGFLISDGTDKLMFATDTKYLRWRFKGLTIIALECNFGENMIYGNPEHIKRVRNSHMSFENVIDFLKANDLSKVREIHLLHLSDDNSNTELFRSEVEKLTGIPVIIQG